MSKKSKKQAKKKWLSTPQDSSENVIVDVREGLPSASGIDSYEKCPGKFYEEKKWPEVKNKYGHRGTQIHKAIEGLIPFSNLSESDQTTADIIINLEAQLCDEYEMITADVIQEQRLWYYDENVKKVFSGQLDVLRLVGKMGMVIDYKTGWIYAGKAKDNRQIQAQCILAAETYDLDVVIGIIIQPMRKPMFSQHIFRRKELDDIKKAFVPYLKEVISGRHSKLVPHPSGEKKGQCQFCSAFGNCAATSLEKKQSKLVPINSIPAILATTPAEKAERLGIFKQIEARIKLEREAYKSDLARDPNSIPDWQLANSGSSISCNDNAGAIKLAQKLKIPLGKIFDFSAAKLIALKGEGFFKEHFQSLTIENLKAASLKKKGQ